MKKRDEIRYFDKEWKDMKVHLKSFFKKEQQEDLHRFRVEVKKIRAFLILSESTSHHSKLTRCFKPVRQIFKQAGEIRNAYMNQELGRAQQIHNDEFMSRQYQLQVIAEKKFKSKKVRFLGKLKGTHRVLKKKIKPVSDLHISLFYQTWLEQIADSLAELKFDEQLHTCRKRIKILIYNYRLARVVPKIGFNVDYLERVQTAIGDWHDHLLAMALFSSDEVKDIAAVTRLKKQDSKLKRNIIALTKDFYNQAITVVELPVEQIS
jgi:CHAD domain-containing protein